MTEESFEINGTKIRAKIPNAEDNLRLEAILPGEQATRFHDIFIVKSYSESTKEIRYDLTFYDLASKNHAVIASIWVKK